MSPRKLDITATPASFSRLVDERAVGVPDRIGGAG
jgi:hypothetical protein